MMKYYFNDIEYTPVSPRPDSEAAAELGTRIVLRHDRQRGPVISAAPIREMRSGLVIGITDSRQRDATD